ncbi:unnamed protein product, partial [Ixodes pacificus]
FLFFFFFFFNTGTPLDTSRSGMKHFEGAKNHETVNGFPVSEVETCRKAYNKTLLGDHVERCVYICEGLPLRIAKEENGTPCKDTYTEDGTCQDGNCIPTSS